MLSLSSNSSFYYVRDWVTFGIAILTFVITLIQLVYHFRAMRTVFDLNVELFESYAYQSGTTACFITLTVQNRSSAPLSILRFSVNSYSCSLIPFCFGSRKNGYDPSHIELLRTEEFPVNLQPHEGKLIRIRVDIPDPPLKTYDALKIDVDTSKRKKSFCCKVPPTDPEYFYLRNINGSI